MAALALACVRVATATPELTRADVEAWCDGLLPSALQAADVAGAVVVVVRDGAVLFQKGYGYADVEARTPVDAERTLFRPGSISKLFTATAVMQLVEAGQLDLDRDVNAYLDFRIPPRDGQPITLRNMLTHTAGFEEQFKGLLTTDASAVVPLETHVKRWTPRRIFAPGGTPAYSNYAVGLAGYIVARRSGLSFEEYVDRHIFAPLGMRHSSFSQPLPERLRAAMSKGYARASEPARGYEFVGPYPSGGLAATGADMARFMIAHLQDGAYGSGRILGAAAARQMHAQPLRLMPPLNGMLLGFYEAGYNGHRIIAHDGGTLYFASDLYLFPDDGIGLFVSLNSTGRDGEAHRIHRALFERFTDRYLPGPAAQVDGAVAPASAREHAQLMAGWYQASRRAESNFLRSVALLEQMQVEAGDDGMLVVPKLRNRAGVPLRWREIAPFLWREVDGKHLLAAQVADGRVTRFSIDNAAPALVLEPAPVWRSAGWLLPCFLASLAVLLSNGLLWPVAALVRRHYQAPYPLAGRAAAARRAAQVATVVTVALLLAWAFTFAAVAADYGLLVPKLDGWWRTLLILTPLIGVGGLLAGAADAWFTWTSASRWGARIWSALVALALLTTFWMALAGGMLTLGTDY